MQQTNNGAVRWHGFSSTLEAVRTVLITLTLVATMLWGGMEVVLDGRYAQVADVSEAIGGAVHTIELNEQNGRITDLETRISLTRRRIASTSDAAELRALHDEENVLLDAKAAAERRREEILKQLKVTPGT